MPSFTISNRTIGTDHRPLVIAEIGINHEGSLAVAKQMVDAAVASGAEMIKHQTHVIEDEMSASAENVIPGNADVSIYEIMKRCALNEEDETELKNYTEKKGAIFISTPFSRAAAFRLKKMGVPAYKIGSGECNNYPLIELIASFGKPIILSTGMNDIPSIKKSVQILEKHGVPYALLHCTNVYPTPPNLVRLGCLNELRDNFPNAVIGLSDHCVHNYPALGAVALGASVIERHFTDSYDRPGTDISCSMDPTMLREMIEGAEAIFAARGSTKEAVPEEKLTMDFAFASVVTIKPLKKGEAFTKDNIWCKRPGTGDYQAESYPDLIGKKSSKSIPADTQLKFSDVEVSE